MVNVNWRVLHSTMVLLVFFFKVSRSCSFWILPWRSSSKFFKMYYYYLIVNTCIIVATELSIIDVANRFSRLIIDILLFAQESGKNDGTRNRYQLKWGGVASINEGGGGSKMLCPLCLSNKSFFSIRALAWSLCSFIHESKTTIHVSSGVLVLSNDVTVKLVPRTSCFFMLDVHKNHCQHQEYQRTTSV